jgi:hypothetical protein
MAVFARAPDGRFVRNNYRGDTYRRFWRRPSAFRGERTAPTTYAIFDIERTINDLPTEQRRAVRQERGSPLVDDLQGWMRGGRSNMSRRADVAKAIDYDYMQSIGPRRLSETFWQERSRDPSGIPAGQPSYAKGRKSRAHDLGQSALINQGRSAWHIKPPSFPLVLLGPIVELLFNPELKNPNLAQRWASRQLLFIMVYTDRMLAGDTANQPRFLVGFACRNFARLQPLDRPALRYHPAAGLPGGQ